MARALLLQVDVRLVRFGSVIILFMIFAPSRLRARAAAGVSSVQNEIVVEP